MAKFTERELTQLSFLMAWLVKSPDTAERLVDNAKASGMLLDVVQDLQRRILSVAHESKPTLATLRSVAADLLHENDAERVAVGRLLATALEGAGERLAKVG